MDRDGTRDGFDLEMTAAVSDAVSIPVVASGGAGKPEHLADAILLGRADAALAASIFHFGQYSIQETKKCLADRGIPVRIVCPIFVELLSLRIIEYGFQSSFEIKGAGMGRVQTTAEEQAVLDRFTSGLLKTRQELEIDKVFRASVKLEASDLHLKVGNPPIVRVHGDLRTLNRPPIENEEMVRLLVPMLSERHRRIFEEEGGADFAYVVEVDGVNWRFRVNMLKQLGQIGLVARRVNNYIPNFEGLYLPPVMEELCKYDQGMVLLAGVTGSGKSTTIASMLNWINRNYRKHILTLEDPIEFVYTEDKCLINQREVGVDVKDFEIGMKHAVREDPDIILVGEMRDEETFMTAIHAAETGHLVFGTIHASSAPTTIGRILDLFPEELHMAIRNAMAFNMKGIVAQKL